MAHLQPVNTYHPEEGARVVEYGDWVSFPNPITLNEGLLEVYMGWYYNHPVVTPSSLISLHLAPVFSNQVTLNHGLKRLQIEGKYTGTLMLPSTVTYCWLADVTDPIIFPENSELMKFRIGRLNRSLILPSAVKTVLLKDMTDNGQITFPDDMNSIHVSKNFPLDRLTLSKGLQTFTIGGHRIEIVGGLKESVNLSMTKNITSLLKLLKQNGHKCHSTKISFHLTI